jgi:iron complex outermembrane receptor protein
MSEIIVTAGRVPLTFSSLARSVVLIDEQKIKGLPVNNIQDVMKYIGGMDFKSRGVEGVQGDVSIRGGTFEQTLILINGMRTSDPQTGHHNLNIPVSLDNVERIEILKGQGSRIFGPNAFSGAINIITKKSTSPFLSLSVLGGNHSLYETGIAASYPIGITGNSISFTREKSDGHRLNTDFDITNFSLQHNISTKLYNVNLFFGYNDKKFGANSFYSNLFPNQWEHTTTKLLNGSVDFSFGDFLLSPKIFWRRNDDDFFLDHNRPDWNRNIHQTNSYGAEIQSSLKTQFGTTSFGGEIGNDRITSSNLGEHSRTRGGFFAEQVFEPLEEFTSSVGFFVYNYSGIGWKFWPGVDIAYRLNERAKVFASAGKAFRMPTFTDLYYKSPANIGNPDLTYEETINYEVGFSFQQNIFQTDVSFFLKDGKNLIDWVRADNLSPWKVENVTSVKTYGLELSFSINVIKLLDNSAVSRVELSYTYLTADRSASNFESKYLLDHLRHQLIASITNDLPFEILQNWSFRFQERVNVESQFTVDTQLLKRIDSFEIFIRATNIFDKIYSDFSGVELPGRWLSTGVKYLIK